MMDTETLRMLAPYLAGVLIFFAFGWPWLRKLAATVREPRRPKGITLSQLEAGILESAPDEFKLEAIRNGWSQQETLEEYIRLLADRNGACTAIASGRSGRGIDDRVITPADSSAAAAAPDSAS